jgi:hypothetical protein
MFSAHGSGGAHSIKGDDTGGDDDDDRGERPLDSTVRRDARGDFESAGAKSNSDDVGALAAAAAAALLPAPCDMVETIGWVVLLLLLLLLLLIQSQQRAKAT